MCLDAAAACMHIQGLYNMRPTGSLRTGRSVQTVWCESPPSRSDRGPRLLVRAAVLMRAKVQRGHREECSHSHNETERHQLTD